MILIIGGTSEGEEIYERLKGKYDLFLSVATESGKKLYASKDLIMGRMNKEGFKDFIAENNIDMIIDASHPFAVEVTKNASEAAKEMNINYLRYARSVLDYEEKDNIVRVPSYEAAFKYIETLKDKEENFLFTTGSNRIKDFEKVRGKNRFIYRVLPSAESIKVCDDNHIEMKNIVAQMGPFTLEENIALIDRYDIKYLVSKESGKVGGTDAKLDACLQRNIICVIITREEENALHSIDEVINYMEANYGRFL